MTGRYGRRLALAGATGAALAPMARAAGGDGFLDALRSAAPAPDRGDGLALYAFLVGSWTTSVVAHAPDGRTHENAGEIHAAWVLEGRAIQDVWILPARGRRSMPLAQLPVTGSWYGTTLRIYDPGMRAWHILWSDPATLFFARQIGRAVGNDIVQQGEVRPGTQMRWSFTDIRPDAFHWTGDISADDGRSWQRQVDIQARRSG